MYYDIDETAARRAKEANSYREYQPGSTTAAYRKAVDNAAQIAETRKKHADPMYHGEIDRLLDRYAKKLAANLNQRNIIDARVPSILIAGPSNFPVRAKEKQNAARDRNMEEWRDIQGLLDKIQSIGMGGISADDPRAVEKLEDKLAGVVAEHTMMKSANAYYRKHKTLEGFDGLSRDAIAKINVRMDRRRDRQPYPGYLLSYALAEKKRLENRIQSIARMQEKPPEGWMFPGGQVVANTENNRLQILFDEKPGEELRAELKRCAFRWAPSAGAWQRQLTQNALNAARRIPALQAQGEGSSHAL